MAKFQNETLLNDTLINKVDYFRENGFICETSKFNLYKGYKCYADRYYQSVINYDGNVFKCTARNFTEENRDGYINEDGIIKWNINKKINRFANATFENEKCLNCKLLPVCMGPCSQKIMEEKDIEKICDLNLMEYSVDDYIINQYKRLLKDKQKATQ